ncbi:MAG: DUF935 family protein [Taibaiella sp.]|nr:DUF935 family protein [Taibaiella sp.]
MPQPKLQGDTALAQPTNADIKEQARQLETLNTPNINPFKEYVSGGALTYLQDYYRTLPQYIDDITADFGTEIYDRMLKDSQVTSAFESLRMGVLASGINFPGRVQDAEAAEFAQSEEVRGFVERNLTQRLNQPFRQICYDLLEGMASGHKVAELIYEYADQDEADEDKGKIVLKAIKVKPQRATAFVVDAYYNVVALIGLLPGYGMNGMIVTQGLIANPSNNDTANSPNNLLPREKFAVFTYRPQDSDPRGTSILRPAYDPWWCKQQVKKDYLAYMARFGSPSLIGYTPEDSVAFPVSDSYANPTLDNNGVQQYRTPEELMGTALAGFKNGYYMVLPGGSQTQVIEATGDGSAFTRAFEFYNTEITKGIQYQTLSTNEGQHDSRAASQTHENVKDMVINFAKEALADCINWDVIYNLVRYNYGEDIARRFAPLVSFSEGPAQDFSSDAGAVAALQTSGYLHTSQLVGIDAKLNLPARDLEQQLQEQADAKQAQADQQQQQLEIAKAKVNQPPPGQGNNQQQQPKNKGNQA